MTHDETEFTRRLITVNALVWRYPGGKIEDLPPDIQQWCLDYKVAYCPPHDMERRAWLAAREAIPDLPREVPEYLMWSGSMGMERAYPGNTIVVTSIAEPFVVNDEELDEGIG